MATESAVVDSEQYTGSSFDLRQFLERSRQLDVSDVEWDKAGSYPISEGEIRCLQYMMDIEAYTLCYLRDLLDAGAGADPEIADFSACWFFEEMYHGRAIERVLKAAGIDRSPASCAARPQPWREKIEAVGSAVLSKAFPREFVTLYMTWGAIQEHTTLFGYTNLARKTANPVLADVLARIARQESRHFGFYYYKAHQGLKRSEFSRKFASFFLRKFWTPVGEGAKPASEADFMLRFLFDGPEGREAVARIDRTMSRLPGLEWFDLMGRRAAAAWSAS
jgi:hypothetical protein